MTTSFEQFVDDRLPRLLRLTGALTGDRHLAEDLVQEVLVRVHRDWERIRALDIPEAYVRRMLVNEYVSWRRRWSRQVPHADPDPGGAEPDHADRIADRHALAQRLLKLPRRQRAVVALRYYEGLSDADIAETLGCSPGTVRAHASRALAALRVDGTGTPAPAPLAPRPGGHTVTTVDLLRDTLRRDAESAAAPDRVVAARARLFADPAVDLLDRTPAVVARPAGPRRRLRPLGVGVAGLAAVAVAALVVTMFVAVRPGGGSAPSAAIPSAALPLDTYAFSVGPDPGGLEFSYQGAWTGVQGGVWNRPGMPASTAAAAVLDVVTGAADAPLPVRPTGAVSVAVGDAKGWSAPWTPDLADLRFSMDPADTVTVWRDDTSGLSVALLTDGLDATRIAQLARSVQVADYHPVRVPVRLAWVPPGSVLTEVGTHAGFAELTFGEHGTQFSLGIGPAGTVGGGGTGTAPARPLSIGALHGNYVADDPLTVVSNGKVDVAVSYGTLPVADGASPAAMPLDTLTRLLAGLTVADLDDPAGWSDLAVALPL